MAAVVRVDAEDVSSRLLELSLSIDILMTAAKAGHTGRMLCNEYDPLFIPGTEAWRFTVRTLREQLVLTGAWRKDDPGNYALVVNDQAKINVVVASGDVTTGCAHLTPRTKSLKGLYTEAAVQRNLLRQGDLFPESLPESVVRKAITLAYPTWIFLVYSTKNQVCAELSFPAAMQDGDIVSWRERIILPEINIDPSFINDSSDLNPDFDIPVRLKG